MVGAGIFAAARPAAQVAGSGLILATAFAAVAAYLNATTMAQLAAKHPESGGAYAYGRHRLGNFWGFMAGWGFVFGKMASCTAMALTFAHYVFPSHAHMAASLTTLLLTTINYMGVKKTAAATKILLAIVFVTLFVVVSACFVGGEPNWSRLHGWFEVGGISGVLEAAGIMFFAFAGYARIATLGEEIIDPRNSIPRATFIALTIVIILYFMVIATTLASLPLNDLRQSNAPLFLAVSQSRYSFLSPLVRLGAAVASLSVLLSLLAGVSRTVFAMAANKDLPNYLGVVHSKHKIPHRAEVLVGVIVALIVGFFDLRTAIGFSSFAILTYYAIANFCALTLTSDERLFPKSLAVCGLFVCILLALSLPTISISGGVVLFVFGGLYYHLNKRTS